MSVDPVVIQADNIVVVIHRKESHWSGELIVNGDSATGCTAGSAEAVLDSLWSLAFHDQTGTDAFYSLTALEQS